MQNESQQPRKEQTGNTILGRSVFADRMTIIKKNKKNTFSIQIWVEALKSWLVFDNFKSRKRAKEFLADEEETKEREAFIERQIKKQKK